MNIIIAVPIAFFAFLAVVLIVPAWLRHRSHSNALRVISEAAANGHTPDIAVIERLLAKPKPAVGKWFTLVMLVWGVGALSVGTALTLSHYLLGARTGGGPSAGPMVGALVNLSIGAGLLTLGAFSLRLFSGRTRPAPRWDYAAVLALVCLFLGVSGISIATGLGLAAYLFIEPISGGRAAAEMLVGALVNACSGLGFTAIGMIILRLFANYEDSQL